MRSRSLNASSGKALFRLTLSYDGSLLLGWQRQSEGRTVQAELEATLRKITGQTVRVTGAGRTDSGVHAEGQVAHARIATRLTSSALRKALNALLPADILVRSARRVPAGFHARYSAKSKHYRYTLWNHPLRPLFERDRAVHIRNPLDVTAMRRAAQVLRGRHDFRAFCSEQPVRSGCRYRKPRVAGHLWTKASRKRRQASLRSTVRSLRRLSIRRDGPRIVIDAEADGFLYHMVRRIAGHLIEVGKGKPAPAIPPTAPAHGLCLVKVNYGRR